MGLSSPTYQIGSWAAGDTGVADANGTVFAIRPQGTTGVFDGAGVRLNHTPFPDSDGAQRSDSFDTTLPITLSGWARGTSVAGTIGSRRAFVGLFSGGTQQTMTVTDLDGSVLTVLVEKADIPRATPANGCEFDWQLSLIAANPRKFGPAQTASTGLPVSAGGLHFPLDFALHWANTGTNGLIQLTNSGTAEAWPMFTITGPTDGATLTDPVIVNTETGDQLAYTGVLNTGDTLVISTSPFARYVRLNGVPYRRFLTTAEWFSVPPGDSVSVQFQGTSSSTTSRLAASLAPAYQ